MSDWNKTIQSDAFKALSNEPPMTTETPKPDDALVEAAQALCDHFDEDWSDPECRQSWMDAAREALSRHRAGDDLLRLIRDTLVDRSLPWSGRINVAVARIDAHLSEQDNAA